MQAAKRGYEAWLRRSLMLSSFVILPMLSGFFSAACGEVPNSPHALEAGRVQEDYNALLDSLATQPLENRLAALQFFLHRHPNCAAAYARLLECYFGQNQLSHAEAFFDSISKTPQHAVLGSWMLAKVFVKQERIESARAAFTRALVVAPPSLLLLKDFTEFCQRNRARLDPQALIAATIPRREDRQSAKALLSYHHQDYAHALEFFQKQWVQSPENLALLQLLADCLLQMRRNLEAAAILRKGLAQAGREKDFAAQAWFLTSLGLLKQREGIFDRAQYQNAESFYQSAYALAARYDDA
ncbi:tetratricopeptide repeat protein, partial [candidate division KSB1 bacterium]|nr:tetratricopeptide repeat protein [candidate division KSB1 bacterium]